MKYITSVWSTLLLVSALILLRVYDPTLVEQIRLNTFDQYIKTLPEQKSNDMILY